MNKADSLQQFQLAPAKPRRPLRRKLPCSPPMFTKRKGEPFIAPVKRTVTINANCPAPTHSMKAHMQRDRAILTARCAAVVFVVFAGALCVVVRYVGPDKGPYRLPPSGYTSLSKHKTSYVTHAVPRPR